MPEWIAADEADGVLGASMRKGSARPWLGIHYACAGVYGRVILDRSGTHYQAVCPKCSKRCTIRVGEGGTSERMFTVTCAAAGDA